MNNTFLKTKKIVNLVFHTKLLNIQYYNLVLLEVRKIKKIKTIVMRFRCVESSTNLLLAMAMTLTMAIAMGKDMTMSMAM